MGFATEITDAEAELGFELVEHSEAGVIAVAPIGNGLRAVKLHDGGIIRYAICDERLFMLYEPADSLPDLMRRFGHADRFAG